MSGAAYSTVARRVPDVSSPEATALQEEFTGQPEPRLRKPLLCKREFGGCPGLDLRQLPPLAVKPSILFSNFARSCKKDIT